MIPFRMILAHWRKNPVRSTLTALSVTVAVFLFCSLRSLLTTLDSYVNEAPRDRLIVSNAVSLFGNCKIALLPKLEAMPEVRRVGHHTWFGGTYVDPKNFFARFALDVPAFRDIYGDRAKAGPYQMPSDQWEAFETERNACIVGRGLVKEYGFQLGQQVTLKGDIYPVDLTFTIRGIYDSSVPTYDDLTMFFHWKYLNEAVGQAGECSLFVLDLKDGTSAGEVAGTVDALFRSSSTPTLTQSEQAFNAQFLTMWGNVGLLFGSIGAVVLAASFLVTLNTMLMAARERVREVGVLKTLGFQRGSIALLYLLEGVLLALAGGAVGIALARLWANGSALKMGPVYFPSFLLQPPTMVTAAVLSLVMGIAAGIAPAVMAARLPIVKALRHMG